MSATYGAVYARLPAGGREALVEALRRIATQRRQPVFLGVLAGEPGVQDFALVDRWGRQDDMPAWAAHLDLAVATELAGLSAAVGEVVACYDQDEGLTMGIYGAWRDGVLVRELLWQDGSWARVDGEPQPWEASSFTDAALAGSLDRADAGEHAEVRAAFAARRFAPGARWPMPDQLVRGIIAACRAQPFGFQPWPPRREALAQAPRG